MTDVSRATFRERYTAAKAHSSEGGVVTLQLSNRIGALISAVAVRHGWHPSVISLGNILAAGLGSVAAVFGVASAHPWWVPGWLALVFWTLAYAFDCSDGQVARLTGKRSEYGARVDVLADYIAQTLIVAGLAVVGARVDGTPIVLIAVMCSVWFFGTFATVLRRSDVESGHSLLRARGLAAVLHTVLDTGFINLLLGAWLVVSPGTVMIGALLITALNAAYLAVSLARETRLSLQRRD